MSGINASCIVLSDNHVLTCGAIVLPFLLTERASTHKDQSVDDIEIDIDMDQSDNSKH